MLPRERVIAVIEHRRPDRIPVYGWIRANLEKQLTEAYGSVEAFEDKYEFDFAHLFGGPTALFQNEAFQQMRKERGEFLSPADVLELPLTDPNESAQYDGLRAAIRHHKEQRGRFVYVQTPGIFERMNGTFGMDNHLAYLLLNQDELHAIYGRVAQWNLAFAHNCIDLGVDMIHVSDDWGAQTGPMFSPRIWREMMYPYHKPVCDAVRRRGTYLSLHSDGNVTPLVDGIIELGYQVLHPFQESAGMDLADFKRRYRGVLTMMGGLDVQTTIGFGKRDFLKAEIERVLGMFADGGLLYCTSHFVQDHCTVDELAFAYDHVRRVVRDLSGGAA
jgi:uroporphyrinogen decarboxylase